MSDAEVRFRAGDLAGALDRLQADVRRNPADPKLRVFLAELLMISGQWERAATQLGVIKEMDASAIPMAHTYRAAIECELLRKEVFAGRRSPLVLGDPPVWIASLIEALACDASGDAPRAAGLRSAALESAAASSGALNGKTFEWIADADSRLGPVLEVLLNGAYYWVPFERIRRIVIEAPVDARDLVWLPAEFTWNNEGTAFGLIPTRYPGSDASDDAAIRLSRKTVWEPLADESYRGLGQRVIATDTEEYGLLDVRELSLAAVPP